MSHSNFIHLRVHSAYSLAEGAIRIKQLVGLCEKNLMPAVGIADSGNLFGALDFSVSCADSGIQPIIGVQLYLGREEKNRDVAKKPEPDQIVAIAQNDIGYRNLLKLVSSSFLQSSGEEVPQISMIELESHADGLIVLTGGPLGPLGRWLDEGKKDKAEEILLRLARSFPGRLYVELQRHGLPLEQRIEPSLLELADLHDLPIVATNEPFFTDPTMYEAHDALLCIAAGRYVNEENRRRLTPEHYFKTADEMQKLFADLPDAIDNTIVIAKRCAFMVDKVKPILPPFHVEGKTETDMLRNETMTGLELRLQNHVFKEGMTDGEREALSRPYRERAEYELDTIIKMGFAGYFLIVSEFIRWARNNDVPVGPGRGSGAGSVVAWALTITDLDPLRWGLLFERFLNPERVSMPDFDIDFCQDRRELVIRHVQERYGHGQVAQIITFGKLQARAVLRDVGRVFQMPYRQVDQICKMIPFGNPAEPITLEKAIEIEPKLREMAENDGQVKHLLDIGKKLEGLYRHASTHAAGVVIGDRPLDELVPLYRDPKSDMPVTQFNMKWVEAAGLVKFDFLGLKTLTVLQKAVEFVKQTRNLTIDLSDIPLDDPKTYEMLAKGETIGVFQLESSGMRDVLRKMRADSFEDIIAIVALYRPGPMDNIPHYIAVKHGQEQPDYMHPKLENILKETFGIMIYQEQVMQIAQELSGYSLGGADLLRRAMGKKIQSEMDEQRKTFIDGAVVQGVDKYKASEIFDQVNKFAGYGFNKSHAAAYAMVAYQTAWMKANYPVEFIASSMSYDMHNTDKLHIFRQELERMEVGLLPPDVNYSGVDFLVEAVKDGSTRKFAVRYALAAIKNVGAGAMEGLVLERKSKGNFKDIADFAMRIDNRAINKRQMEYLVRSGALDGLEKNRARLFEGIDAVLREASASASERETGQTSLFGMVGSQSRLVLPNVPDWPPIEKLSMEFDAIGFFLSAHPMDAYSTGLKRLGVLRISELQNHLAAGGHSRVKLAGTINNLQERTSSRGSRYAFLSASDASGMFEVTLFSEILAIAKPLLEVNKPLLFTVDARLDEGQLKLTCQSVENLDEAIAQTSAVLKLTIRDETPLQAIREIVKRDDERKGQIAIIAIVDGHEVEIWLPGGYSVTSKLISSLRDLLGIEEINEI